MPQPPPKFDIRLRVIREPAFAPMTPRKTQVCHDFGIPPREPPIVLADGLELSIRPGQVVFIGGPSGSGKSSLLGEIARWLPRVRRVGCGRFSCDRPLVDAIAPRAPLAQALEMLTACGLGEPRLWIRRFSDLSEGERFRAMLARAVGEAIGQARCTAIVCDEFTAILHRRAARAIAYNLRKLVTRHRLIFIAASTHDDFLEDLQPDQHVRLGSSAPIVFHHTPRDVPVSFRRRVVIEPGGVRDYHALFGPMHYRRRDNIGFVDRVFLMRERGDGEPLGIVVFAHAAPELAMRNLATRQRFKRNLRRLNRELRILRRLVMHPDVRGCGLGHWFVRRTLPLAGVRFVECLAVMGAINPVFEKAGMRSIGRCPMPRGRIALLERMRRLKVDPFSPGFIERIRRYPRVRRLVEESILDWATVMHGPNKFKVAHRPPEELANSFRQLMGSPPLYYLWDRDGEFPKGDAAAHSARKIGRRAGRNAAIADPRAPRKRHDPRQPRPKRTRDGETETDPVRRRRQSGMKAVRAARPDRRR